jgi:hypothetical protein
VTRPHVSHLSSSCKGAHDFSGGCKSGEFGGHRDRETCWSPNLTSAIVQFIISPKLIKNETIISLTRFSQMQIRRIWRTLGQRDTFILNLTSAIDDLPKIDCVVTNPIFLHPAIAHTIFLLDANQASLVDTLIERHLDSQSGKCNLRFTQN